MKRILFAIVLILGSLLNLYATPKEPLGAYRLAGKWHVFDYQGKEMFPALDIEQIGGYSEGLILVVRSVNNEKVWSFMNLEGKIEFDMPNVNGAKVFKDGMAMVNICTEPSCEIPLYGYYNKKGELAIKCEYMDATVFANGSAWVMNKDKRGFIDKTGKFIIKAKDGHFGLPFIEGKAVMHNDKAKFGFIDTTGKTVIPYQYEEALSFSEGLAPVYSVGKFQYIDHSGKVVIPTNRPFAKPFINGYAFTAEPNQKYQPQWQVINKQGIIMTAETFVNVHNFNEGMAPVQQQNLKWKFIDPAGQKVIEKEFDYCDEFHQGLAWASLREADTFGFINQFGEYEVKLPKAEAYVDFRVNRMVK
jgi:hypothetical protein